DGIRDRNVTGVQTCALPIFNLPSDNRFIISFILNAGEYELSPSLSMKEIINRLSEGKLMEEPEAKLTIPEGKSVEEIADIVEDEIGRASCREQVRKGVAEGR